MNNYLLNDVTIYQDEVFRKRSDSFLNAAKMLYWDAKIYREKQKIKPLVTAAIIATYYLAILFSSPRNKENIDYLVTFLLIPAAIIVFCHFLINLFARVISKIIVMKNRKYYYIEDLKGMDEYEGFMDMMHFKHDLETGQVVINQISDDNIRYYVKYNDRTEYRDFNINIVYKKTDSEQIISFCHDHVEISLPEDN